MYMRQLVGTLLCCVVILVSGCASGSVLGLPVTPTVGASPPGLAPVVTPDGTSSPDPATPGQASTPTPSPTTGPLKLCSKTSSPSHGMRYPVVESGPTKVEMNRVIQTWVGHVAGGEDPCPCDMFFSNYEVTRNDGRVLSVVMSYFFHNVHAASEYDARVPVSLDVANGRQIKLTDHVVIDQKFMDAWITAMNAELRQDGSLVPILDDYDYSTLMAYAQRADVLGHDGELPDVQSSLTSDGVTVSLLTPAGADRHITVTLTNDQINLR